MPATEDYLRSPKRMHVVFCISAVALLGTTLWMMWADYDDEWRVFQRKALANVAKRDNARIKALKADPTVQAKTADAREAEKTAKKALQDRAAELQALEAKVAELAAKSAATMRELRVKRAIRDVERATYGLKIRDHVSDKVEAEFLARVETAQKNADEFEARFADESYQLAQAKLAVVAATAERDAAEKAVKDSLADITRMQKAVNKIEPDNWLSAAKRDLMLLPIINGFNSPERIVQDWMPRLEIDLGGMSRVQRFDRCRTCHMTIDAVDTGTNPAYPHGSGEDGSGTFAHPYASHPRLDLFLTSASPHPLPKFGCTSCHSGQGSGTTFQNASHTPNDPHEMHEWAGKYGWFDNHFWEHPMHPKRFEESNCIKCHINVVELGTNSKFGATAPKVTRGYQLVKTYGCFGCHEISGFDGAKILGVDLRLEPSAEEAEKIANDPNAVAGKMRKVGPSLRHLKSKSPAGFVEHWTEEPKQFRPTTRMPQFFKLSNQQDHAAERFNPIELAGMAEYLLGKSQPLELLSPKNGYQPNPERGKELFGTKGCIACHTHGEVAGIKADFGPELSRVSAKLVGGKAGFDWLYTWIREPERHHARTKMPNLFLTAEGEGDKFVDPAADIAAFLLQHKGAPSDFKPTADYDTIDVDDEALNELIAQFLVKLLTQQQIKDFLQSGKYPIPAEKVKGDEIELATAPEGPTDPGEWRQRKLHYVGRKTITKYGCYGCHDIPNFESARPIGTALQDWGKKDRSRLAFEHIHEFLHHHGQPGLGVEYETIAADDAARLKLEGTAGVRVTGNRPGLAPISLQSAGEAHAGHDHAAADTLQIDDVVLAFDGHAIADVPQLEALLRQTVPAAKVELSIWRAGHEHHFTIQPDGSTEDRVQEGLKRANRHEYQDPAEEDRELSAAFYYESLGHHGRPGFLWQKLRQPRSYDFKMIDTKPYDDRLRMPKFPFTEQDIDAIATFVLGLTAEPPNPEYIYNPTGPQGAVIQGEQLIQQFNCAGCHMLEMPEIRYGAKLDELTASDAAADFPAAVALLNKLKPPRNPLTGEQKVVKVGDESATLPVIGFHGTVVAYPNPEDDPEDQEFITELWENLTVDGKQIFPTSKLIFPAAALDTIRPAKGGRYAEWLANRLLETKQVQQIALGWQASPPPLYQEGIKVQTPWLFNFLRNPEKIRHTTVLRMPRFNMSAAEAQALANYFAAVDGAGYPYQAIPEREPEYLATKTAELHAADATKKHDYQTESWKVLNSPLCIKCHAVGGRMPISTDPSKDIRAPNLEMAGERLRPDWLQLWLYHPTWITPYTSMPQNFPPGKEGFKDLFGGDHNLQTIAVRDALLNYRQTMEREGRVVYTPPEQPAPAAAGAQAAAADAGADKAANAGGTN